jgi:hypothetical protein
MTDPDYTHCNERPTVLIFGIGKLGGATLDQLCLLHPRARFVLVSRTAARSTMRANLARYLAAQWGRFPEVLGAEADLRDVGRTAELIHRWRPTVVFNATTPFPWWKLDHLPPRESKLAAQAGSGTWCALDALLPLRLTEALSMAQCGAIHVNGCYPDMTNAFLAGLPSAPQIGIGNISNLVPGLTLGWASELEVDPSTVEIRIVGHHSVSLFAPSVGCPDTPYELEIRSPRGILRFSGPDDRPFEVLRRHASRVRGLEGLGVTIGSGVTVLSELLRPTGRLHHVPGALGLPGGYSVRFSGRHPVLDLPAGMVASAAAAVNARAQVFDGVQSVSPGCVSATTQARSAYREIVGADLPEAVSRDDVETLSHDAVERLNARFKLGLIWR